MHHRYQMLPFEISPIVKRIDRRIFDNIYDYLTRVATKSVTAFQVIEMVTFVGTILFVAFYTSTLRRFILEQNVHLFRLSILLFGFGFIIVGRLLNILGLIDDTVVVEITRVRRIPGSFTFR
jgi:hypothetical protein